MEKTYQRHLLAVQGLSNLAQWADIFLVFSIPAFVWKCTAAEIALVAALLGVPGLLLGPLAGAAMDRARPLRWMRRAALLRCAAGLALAAAPGFAGFCALILVKGLARTLYGPCAAIVTQRIVAGSARYRYFADLSALDHLGKLAAPLLAGLAMNLLLPTAAFAAPALLALLCRWGLRGLPPAIDRVGGATIRSGGRPGPGRLPPAVSVVAAVGCGIALCLALYDPHLPGWLAAAGFDVAMFSWIVGATAVGAVAAALAVRHGAVAGPPSRLVEIGASLFCLAVTATAGCVAWLPAWQGRPLFAALWLVNGFGYEMFSIGASLTLQNLCPPERIGRVSGTLRSLQLAAVMLGPGIGAWLILRHGHGAAFGAAAGGACLLVAALAVVRRRLR